MMNLNCRSRSYPGLRPGRHCFGRVPPAAAGRQSRAGGRRLRPHRHLSDCGVPGVACGGLEKRGETWLDSPGKKQHVG